MLSVGGEELFGVVSYQGLGDELRGWRRSIGRLGNPGRAGVVFLAEYLRCSEKALAKESEDE